MTKQRIEIIPRKATGAMRFESGAPGFYAAVPDDAYFALDACSNSRLSALLRSPAHMKEAIDRPADPTPAMTFGTAVHLAVLQPHEFAMGVDCARICSGSNKDRSACGYNGSVRYKGSWFCKRHAPNDVEYDPVLMLSAADYEAVLKIRDNILNHEKCKELLQGTLYEGSMLWEDARTGLLCKGRCDHFNVHHGVLVDIKTTKDASPRKFERAIFDYGYYRQGAMYLRGLAQLGVSLEDFAIIAVEKEPPYAIAVYRLADAALKAGRDELNWLLDKYQECQSTGVFEGYPPEITTVNIPQFSWDVIYDRIDTEVHYE